MISSRETPCCCRESDHTDCKKSFEPSTTTSISCLRDSSSTLCRQEHLTRDFSHAPCTCDHIHIVAQGVSVRISLHPHAIHDVTCFERAFVVSSCLSLSCFSPTSTFFSFTVYLFSVPHTHLQCRHRRGLKPLHSRTMRSVAPWRYTILSHPEISRSLT